MTPDLQRPAGAAASEIRLDVDGPVTLLDLQRLVESWTGLLGEIGKGVTGSPEKDAVRYVVTMASGGSFALAVRAEARTENVAPALLPEIAETVTAGIDELNREPRRPRHFSDDALNRLRDLAGFGGAPLTPSLRVSNGRGDPVALSPLVIEHVNAVLASESEARSPRAPNTDSHLYSIGTVEGEIGGLIIRGEKRFYLYDRLTGRRVKCRFVDPVSWEELADLLGQRVAVTGKIRSNPSGRPIEIEMSSCYVFPPDDELPTAADVRGILRNREQ